MVNDADFWVQIEDRSRWLIDEYKVINPANEIKYTEYWTEIKKRFIEGMWAEDFDGYRYCSGKLQFYGNMCTILHEEKKTKDRIAIRPHIRDLEWTMSYGLLEARGFAGFKDDFDRTCYHKIKTVRSVYDLDENFLNEITLEDGKTLKKYVKPREYLYSTHDRPMGSPYYYNPAKNFMILGTRSGGKSYYISLAEMKHDLTFDGIREYTQDKIDNPPSIKLCIGSVSSDKSGDFIDKIKYSMSRLATDERLGAWGKPGDYDWTPNPFYRDFSGNTKVGNKQTGGWAYSYKKNVNGRWVDGYGTGTALNHVSYNTVKRNANEAAAGGRYYTSTVEEAGLLENSRQVHRSNNATVNTAPSRESQFGTQIYLGTSGNIETIVGTKEMFLSPKEYNFVEYPNYLESTDKPIGFFIPAFMAVASARDRNGNTDFGKARAIVQAEEDKNKSDKNPLALRMHRMNYPTKVSHMWTNKKGSILPSDMAGDRVRDLEKNAKYKTLGVPMQLTWHSDYPNKIKPDVDLGAEPFYEIRGWNDRESLDGCVMVYEKPVKINGVIPNDMYRFVGHDPYVADNQEDGGSLGCTHVLMNPKYWDKYLENSPLVATYIGKPYDGKESYYQTQEKLLAYYGNPVQGLWYEANKGQACRDYYLRKNKIHLLCLRPQRAVGSNVYEKRNTQYGWLTSNRTVKIQLLEMLRDFLLETIKIKGEEKHIIETLPCLFTLMQIESFSLDEGNWDAVMSFVGAVLGIKEMRHFEIREAEKRTENKLKFISENKKVKSYIKKHYGKSPQTIRQW